MQRRTTRLMRLRRRRRLRRFRLNRLEKLEPRCLLAIVSWDGGGDGTSWNDPLNWSTDSLPTSADDVTIQLPASDPTIRIATADVSIQSLVTDESIRIENGRTLQVSGSAVINATLLLDGARLQSGSWDTSGGTLTFTTNTSRLEGVTLLQPLVVSSGGRLELTGGSSYPSVVLNGGKLGFEPGESLVGDIRVEGATASYVYVVDSGVVTVPVGRMIDVSSTATLYLGQSPDLALGADRSDAIVNAGTIQTASGTIEIASLEFVNEPTGVVAGGSGNVRFRVRVARNRAGAVVRSVGGELETFPDGNIPVTFYNDGTLEVRNGVFRNEAIWAYSDTGVLILDNATTYFGGRATVASLGLRPTDTGRFVRTGGTFYMQAGLDLLENAAGTQPTTLTINGVTGDWIASNARFRFGTLRVAPGYRLPIADDTIFQSVSIPDEWVVEGGGRAFIYPGTTFSSIRFIAGKVEYPYFYPSDITIPNVVVAGGGWGILTARRDIIVPQGTTVTVEPNSRLDIGPVRNRGMIQSNNADLYIRDSLVNETTGQILVESGDAAFQFMTSLQNDGLIRVRNGRFLTGGEWKPSSGTLVLDNAETHFGSTTTVANLGLMTGRFQRTGGFFGLYSTLDLLDAAGNPTTLVIDARTGNIALLGGTLRGGAVRQEAGYLLAPYRAPSVLDDVDVLDELFVHGGDITLVNGSTYGRARLLGGTMIFGPNTPLSGDVEATGGTYSTLFPDNQGELEIPPGVRVYTSSGGKLNFYRAYYTEFGRVVNRGTIESVDGEINIRGLDNRPGGVVRAANGNKVVLQDVPYNFADNTLTGGTWIAEAGGIIEFPMESVFRTNAARLELRGPAAEIRNRLVKHDFLRTLKINESGGSITIADGRTFAPIDFENRGELIIEASTFAARSRLRNSGTIRVIDGGTMSVTPFGTGAAALNQYADRFVAASSSFSWQSKYAVLGAPDAGGAYPSNRYAARGWFPSARDGTLETLTVDFTEPVYATEVAVREISGNGFVRKIELRTAATGQFTTVFAGTDTTPPGFNDLVVTFPQTAELVDAVRITVDTDNVLNQFEGIDAVSIRGQVPENSGAYIQTAGRTSVDTTLTVPSGLELRGGVLEGIGDVIGNVDNSGGVVSPGASPGVLDIQGDYRQGSGGRLLLEIAGRDPNAPEFDRLRVTGTMTIDGGIDVELIGGFEPAPGDEFNVLSGALRLGEFADYGLPSPGGGGRRLSPLYSGTGLKLQNAVIPPLEFVAATTSAEPLGVVVPRRNVFDQAGNSYVVGSFQGAVDFDREHAVAGDTLTSSGTDGYIASFDPTGRLRWVFDLDGGGPTEAAGIAIAPTGPGGAEELFVTGTFGSSLVYRGTSVAGRAENAFVMRIDTAGTLGELASLPTAGTSRGTGVAVTAGGNAVVSGAFTGTLTTTPASIVSAGADDAFVLEYAFGAGVVRVARLGGSGADAAAEVAIDSAGAAWLVGSFSGSTTGLAVLTASGDPAFGRSDAFVLKLMPFGTGYSLSVAQAYGGEGDDEAVAVSVGPNDGVVVGGGFELSADFDVDPASAFALHSGGNRDLFLLSLQRDGAFEWARNIGGYRDDRLTDVTVDAAGHVYVTGEFRDRVDFDPLDGVHPLETSSPATPEAFIVKLDGAGEFLWATQLGDQPNAQSWGGGVAVATDNRVGVVARFRQSIDVDPTDGIALRTFDAGNATAEAGLLIWLHQKGIPEVSLLGVSGSIVDEGSELGLGVSVKDDDSTYFTYDWIVTLDGQPHLTSDQPVVSLKLEEEGVYRVEVTVRDESGNRDSAATTVVARNAGPVWQPAQYGAATALRTGGSLGSVDAGDEFGNALSMGEDFLLIGSAAGNEAWLYDPTGTTASQQIREFLAPPAGTPADARFGQAVLNLGERLVIGAPQAGGGGAVYVYQWNPASGPLDQATRNFELVRTITAPDGQAGSRFGASLARLGDLVVIGSPGRATAVGSDVGEAYLFDPQSGTLLETFANPTPGSGDEFGAAVAVVDGAVLVGAPGDDRAGTDSGAAHLYDPNTGTAILEILNPTPVSGERFGARLAATGGLAAISDPADANGSGALHLFDLSAGSPARGAWLATVPNPGTASAQFGAAVDAWGARAVVGAPADDPGAAGAGTVYLVDIDPASPRFGQVLDSVSAPAPASGDHFGAAVALGPTGQLFVGAPLDDTAAVDAGAVYQLEPSGSLLLSSASIEEGGVVEAFGAFFDPGNGDSHTLIVDWGDGEPLERIRLDAGVSSFALRHRYADDGDSGTASDALTIRIRLQDDTADLLAARTSDDSLRRFSGTTAEDWGAFVTPNAGGLADPASVAIGPDGDVYVSGGATGTNPVLRFSGLSGTFLSTFLPAGVQGTTRATDLAFGPDGNLYYLDGPNRRVLRFDGGSGAFLDEFVAPGGGGLSDPRGLAFGPEGDLFIADFGSDAVLRYDGRSGDLVDRFPTAAERIRNPVDLAFDGEDLFVLNAGSTPAVLRFDSTTGDELGVVVEPELSGSAGYLLVEAGALWVSDPAGMLQRYPLDGAGYEVQVSAAAGAIERLPMQVDATTSITIVNTPPDIDVVSSFNATADQYTFAARVDDPGTPDTFRFAWSATGATIIGSADQQQVTVASGNGGFSIRLVVTDDDTGSSTYETEVIVGTAGDDTITVVDPPAHIQKTIVFGLQGNDSIDASAVTAVPVELVGGAGDDTLRGGRQGDYLIGNNPGDYQRPGGGDYGNDLLVGNQGDDILDGGLGDDTMIGGAGDDTYIQVPGSADLLMEDGGSGVDTIDYGLAYYGITFDLSIVGIAQVVNPSAAAADQDTVEIRGDFENLRGSRFSDTLRGNSLPNTLLGGAGDDTLFGGDTTNPDVNDGNDLLVGGDGNDTLIAGAGNDVIYGGDQTDPSAPDGNDVLVGGAGDDTLIAGAGDDVIYGGDQTDPSAPDGNDVLVGGAGDDTLIAGAGDDVIYGGDQTDPSAPDGNDLLVGGAGDDTLIAGAGDDVIYGGDQTDPNAPDGNDTLIGGDGDDTLIAGAGDDVIFGGAGDDRLTGGVGKDTFEGGSGKDRLVEVRDADITMLATTLVIAGESTEIHYDIEQVALGGGPGANTLDASGFNGEAILFGFDGDDTLLGTGYADRLSGGPGNDRLSAGDGDDVIEGGPGDDTLDGGPGNDTYVQQPGRRDVLTDSAGIDWLDLGAASLPVTLDLNSAADQTVDAAGNILKLDGTFENVRATSYNDTIVGNSQANILVGGGGVDRLEGGPGADVIQGSFTQVVYLDFDSATGPGEKTYSIEERNAIEARLEELFGSPFSVSFTQTRPAIGYYATVTVNAGGRDENEVLVGGVARELDWRNFNPGSLAAVNVNAFLGKRGQPAGSSANFVAMTATVMAHEVGHLLGLRHSDAFGPIGTNPATGLAYGVFEGLIEKSVSRGESIVGSPLAASAAPYPYEFRFGNSPVLIAPVIQAGNDRSNAFAAPNGTIYDGDTRVATFSVDGNGTVQLVDLSGSGSVTSGVFDAASGRLTLNWNSRPQSPEIAVTYYYDATRPGYRGPDDAFETPQHVMASPASVGSRSDDTLSDTYLSERSLIKLAFADASTTVQEGDLPTVSAPSGLGASARDLGELVPIAVPNRLPPGAVNNGTFIQVRAINVVGAIGLTSAGTSENDLYAFAGRQGELVTLEVLSASLEHRLSDGIDAIIRLYDAAGNPVGYYGRAAVSDDGISSQDPLLLDVRLPATGTYYVEVDTFAGAAVPDDDTGQYELFLYRYAISADTRQGGVGDTLIGGPGPDILIGSAGDDIFRGDIGEDYFVGLSPFDISNRPPTAVDDALTTAENTSASIDVLANDTDPDPGDDPSSFSLDSIDSIVVSGLSSGNSLATGSVTETSEGVLTFQPGTDFDELPLGSEATVVVQYTMSDDEGLSASATLTITVAGTNDAPEIVRLTSPNETPCQASTDGRVTIAGAFSDADAGDRHTVTVDWGDGSAIETLGNVDAATGTFSGLHSFAAAGIYRAQVTVDDGNGGIAKETIRLAVQGIGKVGQTLFVVGTGGRDRIHVRHNVDGGVIKVWARFNRRDGRDDHDHDHDHDDDDGDKRGAVSATFSAVGITRVVVYGCDGADDLHLRTFNRDDDSSRSPIDARLYGGKGNDVLIGGDGDDVLRGGGGNDHIHGRAGNDRIFGGTGDDWISAGRGDDRVDGGKGHDRIRGDGGHDLILGGRGDDRLDGRRGRDLIIGGWGSDRIVGGAGQDLLVAGTTDYDDDWQTLDIIFSEWLASRDYATRIGNIRTGAGNLAGTGVSLTDSTVKRDDGKDLLEGDGGLDAFYYNFDGAGVFDRAVDFRRHRRERSEVRVDES